MVARWLNSILMQCDDSLLIREMLARGCSAGSMLQTRRFGVEGGGRPPGQAFAKPLHSPPSLLGMLAILYSDPPDLIWARSAW